MEEIELTVGMTPFSKKPCLSLRIGSTHRILARFEDEAAMNAYLALQPAYHSQVTSRAALEDILQTKAGDCKT